MSAIARHPSPHGARSVVSTALALLLATLAPTLAGAGLSVTVEQISPTRSTLDAADPDGASGGRVNGLAVDPTTVGTLYAASEWGGIFKSTNNGLDWFHLDGHVPTATWDVEVDPQNSNRVFATSFYDGKVASLSGVNVSLDGGTSWVHPASLAPPASFCATAARAAEPSAYGISIDPANPNHVFVGTNCGLAVSLDRGVTWNRIDPTPADGADDVWDVRVHDGGIIDLCGSDGHRRSTDGGVNWTTAGATPLPAGICSLAVSPDESYVLFAVVGTSIFESDDGGQSWPVTYANPSAQGRIPFVATNQRSGATFDLWFGDVRLFRGTCTTPSPAVPGGAQRCAASGAWAGPFTRSTGAHDDSADIAFAPGAATDACPLLFSSDGGIFRNTLTVSPACQTPAWEQPNTTPTALWNFDFNGVHRAGAAAEDLAMGNQDDGTFGTTDAGAPTPTWNNQQCCDGFDDAGDATRVLNTVCCFGGPRATLLFLSPPGLTGGAPQINTYPPGNMLGFQALDSIANFGPDDYVVVSSAGVFVTSDVGASPVVWSQLGAASSPLGACGVAVSDQGGVPEFFVKRFGCNGDTQGALFRFHGIGAGSWQQVMPPGGIGGFGVYAVDAHDPDRILASHLGGPGGPRMVLTQNGGTTWTPLPALDALMTGGGRFQYQNLRGPTNFTGFGGYPQPTLVAFDPADPDLVVAGAADAGVFLSTNGGTRWELVTDPFTPGTSGTPHVPRPRYAHFDHDPPGGNIHLFLGTQGRGAWRLTFQKVAMPEIQVSGPLHFGDQCTGTAPAEAALQVCNTSAGDLVVDAITSSNPEFTPIAPSGGFPVHISHDFCFPFPVRFLPTGTGPRAADLVVSSNDPSFPLLHVAADGVGTAAEVRLTGSGDFGVVSAWSPAERTIRVCNVGACTLQAISASIDCGDFTLPHDPLPAAVSHDFCLDLMVAFASPLAGNHNCTLTVNTSDTLHPAVTLPLSARTPPMLGLRLGLAAARGPLHAVAGQGSAFHLDFVYPTRPHLAWDLRLGAVRLDGRAGNPDTTVWNLSPDFRYTVNPAGTLRFFLNGGLGAYHFDPGRFEGGGNLGLGLGTGLGPRFALELTYDYHWAFTASPVLRYDEVLLGVLVSF